MVDIDNELKSRRVLGEAYVLAITAAARIIHQTQPTTGVQFGHGILGPGREPDEETPPPSEHSAFRGPPHTRPEAAPGPAHHSQPPPRNSRAAVDYRNGAVAGAPLGDDTVRRRHFMCLSSVQIQEALGFIGVTAVAGDHGQLVDQLLAMSSTTCAQLVYMAHLATTVPSILLRMCIYADRNEASVYITLAKRISQR